jgi:hypothetical protein
MRWQGAAVNADLAWLARRRQQGADYAVINIAIGKKTALRAAFPAQVAELTDTVVERMEIKIAKHVLQTTGTGGPDKGAGHAEGQE